MKTYGRGDRVPVRVQQIWNILVAHAMLKPDGDYKSGAGWSGWGPGLITYGDIAKQIGLKPQAAVTLIRHLGVIGHYCQQEGLPPLNVIAVSDKNGEPGDGVVTTRGFKKDQKDVFATDWFSIRTPSVRAFREVYDQHYVQSQDTDAEAETEDA